MATRKTNPIRSIAVTVKGRTPLLCDRFTEEDQRKATSRTSKTITGDPGSPQEQAEKKLYIGEDGKTLIIPSDNVFACIVQAGHYFKQGRSKLTTRDTSMIPACVEVQDLEIPLKTKNGWTLDERPIKNPTTGGRMLCYRPKFHDWELNFNLIVDTDLITTEMVRDLVEAAGKRVGLGPMRVLLKRTFGKFMITKWAEKPYTHIA